MCGIAGLAGFQDRELLQEMTRRLRHRGPDDEGFHWDEDGSLGHRRLAIIDPEGGAQPMGSNSGRTWVSFNGQIYNFRELKKSLDNDYEFHTECDTEVLPALYDKYGPDMVHHLRGMFAIGIWDAREKTLFLARDRIGIKPLYYSQLGDRLLFASEPKSLLACTEISREIDLQALDVYLSLLYIPPPLSIYRSIRQLPPGHTLTWKNGEIRVDRYWEPKLAPDETKSLEEWCEEVSPLIEESIRMRMISDVPLGAFLSGGIDSSTIVSTLAGHSGKPVETFCIGFGEEGKSYEERPAAREVSNHFGTNHHELEVSIDITDSLQDIVRAFDEPFGNPTAMLSSALSKFTRESVTVALAGDGGDEVFGGYPRYQGMLWANRLSRWPRSMRTLLKGAVGRGESSTARNYRRWARELLEGSDYPPAERYARWVAYCDLADRDRILSAEVRDQVQKEGRLDPVPSFFNGPEVGDDVGRATYADLFGFLPENVLRYTDRMSMAHSLEVRVPFADHKLVEVMLSVPSRYRTTASATKVLLRRIMRDKIPKEVIQKKKLGLNPPMGIWLQEDKAGLLREYLNSDSIRKRGLLDGGEVERLIGEHRSRRKDHGMRLWSLVVLEAWSREYIDG